MGVSSCISPGASVWFLHPKVNVRQVAGIDLRDDPDGTIVVIRFACDCSATPASQRTQLRLDIKENPKQSAAAAKPSTTQGSPLELEKLREALTAKLAILNGKQSSTKSAPPSPVPPALQSIAGQSDAPKAPPVPPVCPPQFDPSGWIRHGNFVARLKELRTQIATTHNSQAAMADLADFYLLNGLAGESFSVAAEALAGDVRPEDRERLTATGGIARLLQREPLDPAVPMPAISPDCRPGCPYLARPHRGRGRGCRQCRKQRRGGGNGCAATGARAVAGACRVPYHRCCR